GPQPAEPQPPHLEDVWVRSLRPRGCLAAPQQRQAILEATLVPAEQPLFGAPLTVTYAAASLQTGAGERSLATVLVPRREIKFTAVTRAGAAEPDFRVVLPVQGAGARSLPVKDHHLIRRIESASTSLDGQLHVLTEILRNMGDPVAVRLGLSRAFVSGQSGPTACWLMADGFFSFTDPQP
ncbi:MAG TPA: hypothetical protein VGY58_17010, partial [Gemmataceae bacterium]|nr:hypothetical protein [Gemmataceae bacterium]